MKHFIHTTAMHINSVLFISLLATATQLTANTWDDPLRINAGGDTTVFDHSRNAFTYPAPNLTDDDRRGRFFIGNSFFKKNWVIAPASTAGRDGLGPLFNARSCSSCHTHDGRGRPPQADEVMTGLLFRLSIAGDTVHGAPKPHPVYGGQLGHRAIPDAKGEGDVKIEQEKISGQYPDGASYELMRPVYHFENLNYGPLENFMFSPRVAPVVVGLGLLELIPEKVLRDLADPDDRNNDGISGRINLVWDIKHKKMALGRFGWKANQPSIAQQVAGAFVGDIGITSSLFPEENHMAAQDLSALPNGGQPEISDAIINDVVFYSQTLAVPARRDMNHSDVLRGERLFHEISCISCHTPKFETGHSREFPELSGQTIFPYTDLLLHDMGEELADDRPDFSATGSEWRTPPLWGIGLVKTVNKHTRFLHDGRARGLEEAILWHGGEAKEAKQSFMKLSKSDRLALLRFLESL